MRFGLEGVLYLSTTDGGKCWMLENRRSSKLIKISPGSPCQEGENPVQNKEIRKLDFSDLR